MTEGIEIGVGKITPISHHCIKCLDTMSLALDITIATWVGARFRGDAKHAMVEHREDVEARQTSAGMSGTGIVDQLQHAPTQGDSLEREFVVRHVTPAVLRDDKRPSPGNVRRLRRECRRIARRS